MGMRRLRGLDVLRGVAAIIVALGHSEHLGRADQRYFSASYLAVDFFFLLSGFILSRTYDARLTESMSPLSFFVVRFRRLWPVMSIGAAMALVSFWPVFGALPAIVMFFAAMAFIPYPHRDDQPLFPSNPPAWSILAELAANVIHAAILVRLGSRWLMAIVMACALLLACFAPDLDRGVMPSGLWIGLLRVGMSYTLGMLLWRLIGDQPRWPFWPAVIAMPVLIVAAGSLGMWFALFFIVVASPLLLISGLADTRGFLPLGLLSFPLYAVHYPIERAVIGSGGAAWLAVLSAVAAALAIGWLLEPRSAATGIRKLVAPSPV